MIKEFITYISGTASSVGTSVDRIGFWTFFAALAAMASAIATWLLFILANKELKTKLNEIDKRNRDSNSLIRAEFLNELRKLFFTEKSRLIFMLFDYNILKLEKKIIKTSYKNKKKNYPYFIIVNAILEQLEIDMETKNKILEKKIYSAYEIDDLVLGPLEDIASLWKNGQLSYEDVYDHFSWYLERLWENSEVQKYIRQQRSEEENGNDIYENIEKLYNKIQEEYSKE